MKVLLNIMIVCLDYMREIDIAEHYSFLQMPILKTVITYNWLLFLKIKLFAIF